MGGKNGRRGRYGKFEREKYVMGHVRSQLVPELKMLSKPQTAAEFEALVEQWSMSQPSKRPIYVSKATYSNKPYT